MSRKPSGITSLTKGRALDTFTGFVDLFNWMASWVFNFKVGEGLKLTGDKNGTPTLSLDGDTAAGFIAGPGISIEEVQDGETTKYRISAHYS